MIDLHLHTCFSHDSAEKPSAYIERASRCGAEILGFSEHYDYDFLLEGQCLGLPDLDGYFKVEGNENIRVLHGIEVGFRCEAEDFYKNFVISRPFDYVIDSVHMLPYGACASNPFTPGDKRLEVFYHRYLEDVLNSVKADFDYQIVGHIGYASRHVNAANKKLKYCDFSDIYDIILKEIIQREKCLELNTSSVGTQGDFLPDKDVFKRYFELGGRLVSFGSDAHVCTDLLRSYEKARDFLLATGFKKLCYFERKALCFYNL